MQIIATVFSHLLKLLSRFSITKICLVLVAGDGTEEEFMDCRWKDQGCWKSEASAPTPDCTGWVCCWLASPLEITLVNGLSFGLGAAHKFKLVVFMFAFACVTWFALCAASWATETAAFDLLSKEHPFVSGDVQPELWRDVRD